MSASGGYASISDSPGVPAPGTAEPAEPSCTVDSVQLFRDQALRAYERGERLSTALRATPVSTWAAFGGICVFVVACVVASVICSISIVSRGPGVLRSPGGTWLVSTPIAGSLAEVYVRSGSLVEAGDALMSLDSSVLRSELLQAERRVAASERKLELLRSTDRALFEDTLALLRRDLRLTEERIRSQQGSVRDLSEQEAALRELGEHGFASRIAGRQAEERMRDAERARMSLQQQASQSRLSMVSLARQRMDQLSEAEAEHTAALSARAAVELLIHQSLVRAPRAGRVEAIVAKPGELLAAGAPLARLVPLAPPTQVIAFLPDADRAFVQPGARVRIEVAQLPMAEFGTLAGRVSRIGTNFATPEELAEVLEAHARPNGPTYRIEVELDSHPRTSRLLHRLQAGAAIVARVSLRDRRIIALVFEPLRRMLE